MPDFSCIYEADVKTVQNIVHHRISHPTPIRIRTHTAGNVPYLLSDSTDIKENEWNYNEKDAMSSGVLIDKGHTLIDRLFEK